MNGRDLVALAATMAVAGSTLAGTYTPQRALDIDLIPNDELLVTDAGPLADPTASGVYRIDRDGDILWSYTTGLNDAHSGDRQNDGSVIIADTGNDRVIFVSLLGQIVRNTDDTPLSDGSSLDSPTDAERLQPSALWLITDRDNHRVIEVDQSGNVVWQYGTTGVSGNGANQLDQPNDADRLSSGNTLITDTNNGRVIEVNSAGMIVATWSQLLTAPLNADRLENGNVLIADTDDRIVELDADDGVVGQFDLGPALGDAPPDAERRADGRTIATGRSRLFELRDVELGAKVTWALPAIVTDCPGDLDGDGNVGFNDLTTLLGNWGPCPGGCAADLDGDELVGFNDLTTLLGNWGPC